VAKLRSLAQQEKIAVIKTAKADILEAWNAYHVRVNYLKKQEIDRVKMNLKISALHKALKRKIARI
jgi:hypothetical protein